MPSTEPLVEELVEALSGQLAEERARLKPGIITTSVKLTLGWWNEYISDEPGLGLFARRWAMHPPLHAEPEPLKTTKIVSFTITADVGSWTSFGIGPVNVAKALREQLNGVQGVLGIYWRPVDGSVDVYTVIEQRDRDLQQRIYEAELATLDLFPGQPIGFSVLFRQGRELAELLPQGARPAPSPVF